MMHFYIALYCVLLYTQSALQSWGGGGGGAMIGKGQRLEFGQDTGVTPLIFTRSALGFLITTESQDLGLTSHPKDGAIYSILSPLLYWGVRTHTEHRVSTPCWFH